MHTYRWLGVLALSIAIAVIPALAEQQWKLVKDRNGIKVYREIDGGDAITTVRGVAVIPVGIEVLYVIFRNPPNYEEFLYNCKESRLVKEITPEEKIAVNITRMPWPVADRTVLVKSSVKKDFNIGVFSLYIVGFPPQEYDRYIPVTDKMHLMQKFWSEVRFEVIDRGHTRVTYSMYADPGGIAPGLVNAFSINAPYMTLKKLREIAPSPKFREEANTVNIPELDAFYRNLAQDSTQ